MLHFLYEFFKQQDNMDSNFKSPYITSNEEGYHIVIPTDITTIEECGFLGADVETVILPENITAIGRGAFMGSRLKNIVLPDSLSEIAEDLSAVRAQSHRCTRLYGM